MKPKKISKNPRLARRENPKTSLEEMKGKNPQEALAHPNWDMGKKLSVDSSNLMNKILELIEAHRLFSFNPKKYEIII